MNGSELLRVVDAIHRDKNIEKGIVFDGIEQAILSAARKHFGEESEIVVNIDRDSGEPTVKVDEGDLEPDEIGDLLGRIAAQTAKQVMIQKIREAERDSLYEEFDGLRGQIVSGAVSRLERGAATVNLGKVEGLLPRGEQIPGETHRVGERVRSIVMDVKKYGSRVRIILSRTHPELVRRLFELEIPEVAEHVIEIRSLAREAGYRSKVAVSCFDSKIDCVGACVGVRGSRIRSVVDELAGERIDIVRWNDSLQVLVPNALQPAEVEDVILCPMLGKVIVLVRDDQLSLAIGKKGQNVRLASKLVGWDIDVMTQEKLDDRLEGSVAAFAEAPGVDEDLAENLVAQGFFTFDDLSIIEPEQLAELGGLSAEQCDAIVAYADVESIRIEKEEQIAREARRAEERQRRLLGETEEKKEEEADKQSPADEPEQNSAEAKTETEAESETEAKSETEAESETEVAAEVEVEAETESETEATDDAVDAEADAQQDELPAEVDNDGAAEQEETESTTAEEVNEDQSALPEETDIPSADEGQNDTSGEKESAQGAVEVQNEEVDESVETPGETEALPKAEASATDE